MKDFGKTRFNEPCTLYTIENNYIKAMITDYGATLVSFVVKENDVDIVLGYDSVTPYETVGEYVGQSIGRVSNRIGNGKFTLNDKEYVLTCNNGPNHLHGGPNGFHRFVFSVIYHDEKSIVLYRKSADGEENYPGSVDVLVKYELDEDTLINTFTGLSDQDTLFAMTNHSFFNLEQSNTILNHTLQLSSSSYAPVDSTGLTQDEIKSVENTPFDFREEKRIGDMLDETFIDIQLGHGYDHHYYVNGSGMRHFATLSSKKCSVEISSDFDGFHLYSSNFLQSDVFGPRSFLCIEPQYVPNSINSSHIKPLLKKGIARSNAIEYKVRGIKK